GGAIVVWQDLRDSKVQIFAGHVLVTGELDPRWPVGGRALLTDPAALANATGGQGAPALVPDGQGGAIGAWLDKRALLTPSAPSAPRGSVRAGTGGPPARRLPCGRRPAGGSVPCPRHQVLL